MSSDLKIRKLNVNDYEEYYQLINHFRKTHFTESEFVKILNCIVIQNSDIWVIDLNGMLIGTGTILYEYKFIHNISKLAHIEDICINPNYRGMRYGQLLINTLIEKARENDCYKVTLYCEDKLEKFYSSELKKNGIQMVKYF